MNSKFNNIIQVVVVLAIIVVVNLVAQNIYTYIDLTQDKRFTLEDSTKKLLENVNEPLYIDVLLDGDLDSEYLKLQQRVLEILKQFQSINANIEFNVTNPSEGTVKDINQIRENLRADGILPVTLFIPGKDKRVEKLIYPYAIINLGDRRIPINLLEGIQRDGSDAEAINRSMILLEYKFASSIQKLTTTSRPNIVFTKGNGELKEEQTAMLETLLSKTMYTSRINLDSTFQITQNVDVLIVAKPTLEFSQRSKFIIDQYIMNGGKVIWLIDQFFVDLDSINNNKVYLPRPYEHGLDDMFFKYGIRMPKNLILDMENTKIPQVYGYKGGVPQQQLFSWVYHPLLMANEENPIVRNLDRVSSTFPSSIEILDKQEGIESSVLLSSSQYSRIQVYPSINISFEIMRIEQKPEAYNKPHLPVAVLEEGIFESAYKNRVSQEMLDGLKSIGAEFKDVSPVTSQVFCTDGDIIKNLFKDDQISPIGFNKWERHVYQGNQDFIINVIDYLLDDFGLVESRSKNFKVRFLDQVEILQNRTKWQMLNILLPVFLVLFGGFVFNYWRKKKFATAE